MTKLTRKKDELLLPLISTQDSAHFYVRNSYGKGKPRPTQLRGAWFGKVFGVDNTSIHPLEVGWEKENDDGRGVAAMRK